MPSMPRGLLRQMAGGGADRPKDKWDPPTNRDSAVRLYRYEKAIEVAGETTVEKCLCNVRMLHFHGKGAMPTDCSGGAACTDCRKGSMLEAQGTEEAREKAREYKPSPCPTFVVVPLDEPTRFRTFDARFSAFQGIMLTLAQAGGWRQGGYPKPEAWQDGNETGPQFDRCVDEGANKVCGPNGQDVILTPTAKGKGFLWTVRREVDGCQVLPFPEDSKVLNPEAVQARIKAAMAKKAADQKEGD